MKMTKGLKRLETGWLTGKIVPITYSNGKMFISYSQSPAKKKRNKGGDYIMLGTTGRWAESRRLHGFWRSDLGENGAQEPVITNLWKMDGILDETGRVAVCMTVWIKLEKLLKRVFLHTPSLVVCCTVSPDTIKLIASSNCFNPFRVCNFPASFHTAGCLGAMHGLGAIRGLEWNKRKNVKSNLLTVWNACRWLRYLLLKRSLNNWSRGSNHE